MPSPPDGFDPWPFASMQGDVPPACSRTAARWSQVRSLARALLGVPDFGHYLAHHAAHHPGTTPLTRAEFFALRQDARFGRGASRCC